MISISFKSINNSNDEFSTIIRIQIGIERAFNKIMLNYNCIIRVCVYLLINFGQWLHVEHIQRTLIWYSLFIHS